MNTYKAVVNIQLEIILTAPDKEVAVETLESIELPGNYKEDSFEIASIEQT